MQITDAQIHLWTGPDAPPHHWRAPYTVESALRDMDEAGVDRAVNCPAIWDPDANDYAVEVARRHPDRFATLGWFPLEDADETTVDRWMEKPGMFGLRFVLAMPDAMSRFVSGDLEWLWTAADARSLPMGLMVLPEHLPLLSDVAERHPRMRLLVDHLAVLPFGTLPDAAAHLEALLDLARHPNVAIKATGVPSMATDEYPFASTHETLRRCFEAFGATRMFWGTDVTRLQCSWRECVSMFAEELPWLTGRDLELVMGRALADWIGWS